MTNPHTFEEVHYEELPQEQYEIKYKEYTDRGLAIPVGAEVELTDWAIQNGLKKKPGKFIKTSNNTKDKEHIRVRKDDKGPTTYWAGFWKLKDSHSFSDEIKQILQECIASEVWYESRENEERLQRFLEEAHKQLVSHWEAREAWLRERISKLLDVEDTEREGWDMLEEKSCCPGDDAWTGYEKAVNDILSLFTNNGKMK